MGLRGATITLTGLELHRILRAWGREQADAAGLTTGDERAALYASDEEGLDLVRAFADKDVATRGHLTSISAAKAFVRRVMAEDQDVYTPQSEL